jgi:Gluconate 2-dehydrogenase subunit 3
LLRLGGNIASDMDRRKAVRHLLIVSGGSFSLPIFLQGCHSGAATPYSAMLSAVVDTIIPAERGVGCASMDCGGVGALPLGVDKFLEKLIADCYEPAVRENAAKQLSALDAAARADYGVAFPACSALQRQDLLQRLAGSADKRERDFFVLIKAETIRGFVSSQKVMEDYQQYKVAPGHYYGCVAIKM